LTLLTCPFMNAFALLQSLGDTSTSFQDVVASKDTFSLDLLDHDEFLNEVVAAHPRLLSLMLTPEAAQLQLQLALGEWQGHTDALEKGMRYAHMCSEVMCMDVKAIQDFLLQPELETGAPFLARLLAVLNRSPPLGVVLSQNLCKILSSLIKHRRKETFAILKNQPGMAARLAAHACSSSTRVVDLLSQLVEDEWMEHLGVVEWLDLEGLVPLLLDQLDSGDTEVAAASFSALTELIEKSDPRSPLVRSALSDISVRRVIAFTFATPRPEDDTHSKRIVSGLDFMRTLIDWCVGFAPNGDIASGSQKKTQKQALWLVGAESRLAGGNHVQLEDSPLLSSASEQLGVLLELLKFSPENGRFGTLRLSIGRFLSSLLRTNNQSVIQRFVQLDVLVLCLNLFFHHTLVNMWHHEVLKMVIHVLETDCAELIASLFEKGDILQHILSSADSKDGGTRPNQGHLGHVYLMAQAIAVSKQPQVEAFKQANAKWHPFASTTLCQLKEKNEFSQYAPDEAMRNATTASADIKVMDLSIDGVEITKKKTPSSSSPSVNPPVQLGFEDNANWDSFGDNGTEWADFVSMPQQSASSDSSWATFGGDTNWSTAGDTKKKPAKALYGGADWDSLTNFDDDLCWAKFEG